MSVRDRVSTETLVRVGRACLIVAVTGVETATLGTWLALSYRAPPLSRDAAVGAVVLVVGLLVAHFLLDLVVNGADAAFPLGGALAVSGSEAALWALWLGVAGAVGDLRGVAVAALVLAVGLVVQHTVEDNHLRKAGLTTLLVERGAVGFSLLVAAGATAWLALVADVDAAAPLASAAAGVGVDPVTLGLELLALALLGGNVAAVRFARRSERSARSRRAAARRKWGVR